MKITLNVWNQFPLVPILLLTLFSSPRSAPAEQTFYDGRVRFGSEPLRLAGPAVGFPEMHACEAPADESGTVTNSVEIQFARIEPGSFQMGEEEGDFDERPVHSVRITRPFWMGVTEVTNQQYERFDPKHKAVRGKLGYSTEDDEAVVFVNWHEAVAFCQWLSRTEGKPYRLPTEAEWEYACRAGTTSRFSTGDALPPPFQKNARRSWFPASDRGEEPTVRLTVGQTPPNAWRLRDMQGNVEQWCLDWYGPYAAADQIDPTGRAAGDFRVTRGGSHSTTLRYLRSANRLGTLPEDRSWLIGFRVVQAAWPETQPLGPSPPPANRRDVRQTIPADLAQGPDRQTPYFRGPRPYVKIPPDSDGPLFSQHNHCPALVDCPNGDLLAIWYTCREEPGRELGIAASRLRYGSDQWDNASPFWDAPDRNDHASALWSDGEGKIYHFNGLAAAATWGSLATVLRVSDDSGASWSRARLIMPEHGLHHMPVESVFRSREGHIIVPCDAVTGGQGGSTILISRDGGNTWSDPSEGRPAPTFSDGGAGALIAGIHAGVVQLADGQLLALGRGDNIGGRMPLSISGDFGENWTYRASPFPPIDVGQRLALLRLREGPIFLASFAQEIMIRDMSGKERPVSGLFAALSYDEGTTWSVKRILSDDQAPHTVAGGGNTGKFTMSAHSAEPRGYLSVCQTPDGVIQLISSKQHYAFNLAWLNTAPQARRASLENRRRFESACTNMRP